MADQDEIGEQATQDALKGASTIAHDADSTPTASQSVIEVEHFGDPPTTSTVIANDYFAQLPDAAFAHNADLRSRQLDSALPAHTPKPQPSVAGSNAIAPGTIVIPESFSHHDPSAMRHRDSSRTPTSTMDGPQSRPSSANKSEGESSLRRAVSSAAKPSYPNQSYAALHNQHYSTRQPPTLKTRNSNPSHIVNFPHNAPGLYQSGSRTVGNSPAATPSAGLYSPPSDHSREEWDSPETPGTYASPYLHPTHRQAPKETHIADVDVDPISGRKLINHYEILDELGRGTHGKVKLGRDLSQPNTHVAIKIVERYSKRRRLGKLGNPEDKVKKEVAILKKARHPNIVALLEVIDDPSRKKVYIVLEWVERGTIQWRVKAPKELCMLEARQYERLRGGVVSQELDAEDDALRREVHRRLSRRKHDIDRRFRRANRARDIDRGIDHFGGSNLESDDDTISRTSTEPTTQVALSNKDATENSPADGAATPTAADVPDPLAVPSPHQPDFATLSQAKDMRQWAIEYLDGDLNPELHYVPCMTLPNIRIAFRDTLLGLQYLHHQGIIHRDIKPPNLLQTTEHRVKISDFGVSYLGRPAHEGEQEEISESEAKDLDGEAKELAKTVGTPAFYAPELCITDHIDDPPPVTKAIDVWALGITLFCMVYARTPFVDNEYVVMRQISEEDIHVPRLRLKPVDQRSESRSNSRARTYSPQNPTSRSELDVVYEEIGDDLHDLMKRLLIKDPRKRIVLEEVRHHPWVVADLANKVKWLEETDPNRQMEGKKIEISKEDVNAAVVPLQFLERMRSGIKKFGDRLLGSTSRGRSTSSATPPGSASNSHPASANSSSSTISQDARRHSLRTEEIFNALKSSREPEHPLAQSSTASPEVEQANQDFFSQMPPERRFDRGFDFGAPLMQTMSHDSTRPQLPGRTKTGYSTTGSIRTIKQSDFVDASGQESPPSPHISSTPRALDSPGASSGLLAGSGRNIFTVMRERSAARSVSAQARGLSPDRASAASSDTHAEPSLAVSDALAAGRVEAADALLAAKLTSSAETSPTSMRPKSVMLPPGYKPGFGSLSRQSSTGSITSADLGETKPKLARWPSRRANESSADDWRRADQERLRKLQREANEPHHQTRAFDDRTCPPSPDDHRGRQGSDQRRISELDIAHPRMSQETSPTSHGGQLPGSLVSSSSDFGSAVSMSISNPSIPSVISEASSVDVPDGAPLEDPAKHTVSSHDTIRSLPVITDECVDEGYNAEEDTALDSDDAADFDDSDTDSDGGLVMSRRKSATKMPMLSTSPRVGSVTSGGNLSAALDAHSQHRKQRRGTGVSKSSKKSSRSGSNNTMKKVRTRDSIDERRRESTERADRA